ncbi:MAG: two-component regulator propeller domain-containing protein, partial [Chitinophagaceae bacterium]
MNLIRLFCVLQLSMILPVVLGNCLAAQDINENNFTRYTKEEGLSHNLVTSIAQDSTGFIWISTASGLNRYDGYRFVQFHSNNNSASIPAEYISGLVWLDSHRLGAYAGGLHVIDTRTGQTRNVFIPYSEKQYQYKFNTVQAVAGNEEGDIFMVTRSGFYHFDKNYHLVFRFDYYSKEEVPTTSFGFGRDLLQLNSKELAIISTMGIYYYSIEKKMFKKMEAADCPIMADYLDYPQKDHEFFQENPGYFFTINPGSDNITYVNSSQNKKVVSRLPFVVDKKEFNYRSKVLAINDTLLYLTGSLSGFYKMRLYPESGKVNFYQKKYFPFYYCRDLLQDRNHNLWVATNKGMLREDNSKLYVQQAEVSTQLEALFPNILVDDIYASGDKLYVATRGYAGLLVFDKQSLQFIRRVSLEKCRR